MTRNLTYTTPQDADGSQVPQVGDRVYLAAQALPTRTQSRAGHIIATNGTHAAIALANARDGTIWVDQLLLHRDRRRKPRNVNWNTPRQAKNKE